MLEWLRGTLILVFSCGIDGLLMTMLLAVLVVVMSSYVKLLLKLSPLVYYMA